ncbi:hypothetical protein PU02_0237 [Bartonella ancashensis]|uniref:Uncharacterized protein n=1 Tax=Bartonella ancashensis TaxID=1318743 RepID=A0A0M3T2L4_9HYPH|nr:hypothetical protein PU02_0237 [Bartonella ancashensis]
MGHEDEELSCLKGLQPCRGNTEISIKKLKKRFQEKKGKVCE